MKKFLSSRLKGFSLIELLIVIGVIGLLMGVVGASIIKSRATGRDAEVRSHVQNLKLAFARAAAADPSGAYPEPTPTWRCVKTSGTCWRGVYSGDSTLVATLNSFMPSIPTSPGAKTGEYRFDTYLYSPGPVTSISGFASTIMSGYTGPVLVWWQEKPITDCNGHYLGQLDTGIYYCAERLIQ